MAETNEETFRRMYGNRAIRRALQSYTPLLICPHCEQCRRDVMRRRQNTAYFNEALNWVVCCGECFEEVEANWAERWEEVYADRW